MNLEAFLSSYTVFSVVGLVINILSISYFITKESKGLANKLMICLNLSDILSVTTSIAYSVCILLIEISADLYNGTLTIIMYMLFNSFPIVSGCVTFAITLLRTIVIYNPFFQIRKRFFTICLVLTIVIFIILAQVLGYWLFILPSHLHGYRLGGLIVAILSCLNIVMSAATIIILKKSSIEGHQERNYAAVTMVIISIIYFATSFPILLIVTTFSFELQNEYKSVFVFMAMLSLSCLLNPLVYIYRKRQIRSYAKECLQKLNCRCII